MPNMASASVDFLKSTGIEENDFAFRFLKDMDVAQLSELQETYGDFGGHCMPNDFNSFKPFNDQSIGTYEPITIALF